MPQTVEIAQDGSQPALSLRPALAPQPSPILRTAPELRPPGASDAVEPHIAAAAPPAVRPRSAVAAWPAPSCEPPFDDEIAAGGVFPGQLAFDWSPAGLSGAAGDPNPVGAAALPGGAPDWRLAPAREAGGEPAEARPRTVVEGATADAKLAVRRFLHLCVEVLNGYRPAAHLRRLTLPAVSFEVVAQGVTGAERIAELRRASRAPGRRPSRRIPPVAVARLKVCQPATSAVEAAAALVTAERTWALALRLELHDGTWSATALRLI